LTTPNSCCKNKGLTCEKGGTVKSGAHCKQTSKTLSQCLEFCENNNWCTAFSYSETTRRCWPESSCASDKISNPCGFGYSRHEMRNKIVFYFKK
jgi:hypothetical protein